MRLSYHHLFFTLSASPIIPQTNISRFTRSILSSASTSNSSQFPCLSAFWHCVNVVSSGSHCHMLCVFIICRRFFSDNNTHICNLPFFIYNPFLSDIGQNQFHFSNHFHALHTVWNKEMVSFFHRLAVDDAVSGHHSSQEKRCIHIKLHTAA